VREDARRAARPGREIVLRLAPQLILAALQQAFGVLL
jgi:hypothetical protein